MCAGTCAGTRRVVVFLDTCVLLCTVLTTGAAQQRRVQVQVGQSVNMQCLVPIPSITQWGTRRLFLQKRVPASNPRVVFSFSNGEEKPEHQDPSYRGRCRLFRDNLTLTLSDIRTSDQGEYDCKVFLLRSRGYELEHTGQLILSIWADYSRPQISLFRGGAGYTAVCSSNGGYPQGEVKWTISPNNLDLSNRTQTRADCDPLTLLYNISGHLTLPSSTTGSIYCCVVAEGRRVCSEDTDLPLPETSRAGSRESRRSTVLICLGLMMSLTLFTLQHVGVHVYAEGDR
ncbi:T-lymphocyte activation antigen CD86 [Hyla sarda]|uniref:T-lymphocyte activation antigen CD86 n=1 Tax=Hyla sarda TaxID=327740 RepID=UPI0024C24B20|nr:T-lymphocyte activation antigen CD86 [Hyla sarda]